MRKLTNDIWDLAMWFQEREYTRDEVMQAFTDVIKLIDENSKVHFTNH